MKIKLTRTEVASLVKSSLILNHSTVSQFPIEVEVDGSPSVVATINTERKNAVDFDWFTQTVAQANPMGKIQAIKDVREFFNRNGLYVGLAEAKGFVEAVLER